VVNAYNKVKKSVGFAMKNCPIFCPTILHMRRTESGRGDVSSLRIPVLWDVSNHPL
jgi:hypothetical protein